MVVGSTVWRLAHLLSALVSVNKRKITYYIIECLNSKKVGYCMTNETLCFSFYFPFDFFRLSEKTSSSSTLGVLQAYCFITWINCLVICLLVYVFYVKGQALTLLLFLVHGYENIINILFIIKTVLLVWQQYELKETLNACHIPCIVA